MPQTRVQVDKVPGPSRLQVTQVTPDAYARPSTTLNAGSEFLQMANALSEFRPGLNQFLGVTVKEAENKELQKGFADRMAARSDPNAQNPNAGGFYARAWNEADATIRAEDYSSDVFNAVRNSDLWNKENADPAEFDKVVTPIREKYQAAGKPGGDLWATTFGQRIVSAESSVKALWLNRLQQVRQEQAVNALSITVGNKLTYAMENQNLSPEQIAGILQTEVDGLSTKFNVDKSVASRAVAEGFKSFFTQMTRNESTIGQFDRFVRVFQNMKTDEGPMANTAFGHDVLDHAYGVQSYAESAMSHQDEERKRQGRTDSLAEIMDRTRSLDASTLVSRDRMPDRWADSFIANGGSPETAQAVYRMVRDGRLNPVNSANKDRMFELQSKMLQNPESVDPDEATHTVLAAKETGSITPEDALRVLSQITSMRKQSAILTDSEYRQGLETAGVNSTKLEAELKANSIAGLKTRMDSDTELRSLLKSDSPSAGATSAVFQQLTAVDLSSARERGLVSYYNYINRYLSSKNLRWESLDSTQKLEAITGAKQAYNDVFNTNSAAIITNAQEKAIDQVRGVRESDHKASAITANAQKTLAPDGSLTYSTAAELKKYGGLYRELSGLEGATIGKPSSFLSYSPWHFQYTLRQSERGLKYMDSFVKKAQGVTLDQATLSSPYFKSQTIPMKDYMGTTSYLPQVFSWYVEYNKNKDEAVGEMKRIKQFIADNTEFAQSTIKDGGTGWFSPLSAQKADSLADAIQSLRNYRAVYGMESFDETLKIPPKELDTKRTLLIPVNEWSEQNMNRLIEHLGVKDAGEIEKIRLDQARLHHFHQTMTNNPTIESMGPDIREFFTPTQPELFPQLQGKPYQRKAPVLPTRDINAH